MIRHLTGLHRARAQASQRQSAKLKTRVYIYPNDETEGKHRFRLAEYGEGELRDDGRWVLLEA